MLGQPRANLGVGRRDRPAGRSSGYLGCFGGLSCVHCHDLSQSRRCGCSMSVHGTRPAPAGRQDGRAARVIRASSTRSRWPVRQRRRRCDVARRARPRARPRSPSGRPPRRRPAEPDPDVNQRCAPRRARPGRGRHARPGSIRPASDQPRLRWPASVRAATSSAGVKRPRSRLASRSSISRARASSSRSMTAFWSLPRVRGAPASSRRRAGPTPSARSRSVVGQTLIDVPVAASAAMSRGLR